MTHEKIASLSDDISVEEQVDLLEQDLRAHCRLIRDRLAEIDAASHAEILAFSLLDSLGYLLDPEIRGGGQRIRFLIESLASYEDCTRYSVPALLSLLRASNNAQLQALQNRCQDLFDLHWVPGSLPGIQMDLSQSEVLELTDGRENLQVHLPSGTLIELGQCKHSRMLAEKRNALAHQLVKKGLRSVVEDSGPYYIWRASDDANNNDVNNNNDDNDNNPTAPGDWDLVYPVKFLLNLCEYGILVACSHLREKKIKPYPLLLQSVSWLAGKTQQRAPSLD